MSDDADVPLLNALINAAFHIIVTGSYCYILSLERITFSKFQALVCGFILGIDCLDFREVISWKKSNFHRPVVTLLISTHKERLHPTDL